MIFFTAIMRYCDNCEMQMIALIKQHIDTTLSVFTETQSLQAKTFYSLDCSGFVLEDLC